MENYTRDNNILRAEDYDIYIGLDVDKSSISLSARDRSRLLQSLKIPYDANNLLSYVGKQYTDKRVAFVYEAGPTGFGLYDDITEAAYKCLVVSPGNVPSAPNEKVKTNRMDSKKLALQLSGNQLNGIRVPPVYIRELRTLVHLRYTYMKEMKGYKCRIKSLLLYYGLQFPPAPKSNQWSLKVLEALRNLECSAVVGFTINNMVDHVQSLSEQLKLVEVAIRSHVNGNDEMRRCIKYLMSCPGIGWRIACYTLARIGEWKNLKSSKEAGAFFGIVPTENSTGENIDRGSITKCGDPDLRSMLIQGAWTAIRKDSELKAFYDRVYQSHSIKVAARVAIVAVARKLAERMHCVLKHQRMYEVRIA